MARIVLIFLFCFLLADYAQAQNYPSFSGYFVNPYLYNPAESQTKHVQLVTDYRKQWLGINGAPTISTLGVSTLLNNSRSGIGFKAISFNRGLLNSTDATLSYSYGIDLKTDTKLIFGLSGGAISNQVDWTKIDDFTD